MPLSLQQVQIQSQKLVMTPQMQLSIKLLQMNTLEMEQLAQQEMLENPFLETEEEESEELAAAKEASTEVAGDSKDESSDSPAPETATEAMSSEPGADQTAATMEAPESPSLDSNEGAETFEQVDAEWDDYFDGNEMTVPSVREHVEEERDFTEYTASRRSLYDHLMWQISVSALSEKDREIGEFLIGSIDDTGYLGISLEEVAETLKASVEEVESVLKVIQTFDPTGVGARDLAECLLIQLESRGKKEPIYHAILTKYFSLLAQQRFQEIARALEVEEEDVVEAFNEIRRCEPKPGRSITKQAPRYVEPDIFVKKIDDRYHYYLNEGGLGHLRINSYYKGLLESADGTRGQERDYYRDKYRSAVWLIRNIERRKGTILRVTEAIMEYQKEFLEKGSEHLRPLTLRQIAETVGMHEATIARVTSNKYVSTPRGVFLLKYFFSSSLDRSDGSSTSSRSVKETIRKMIDDEDPKAPLSDSAIAKTLASRGLKIARRTVAKYRDSLKILPANLRKKAPRS